MLKKMIEGELSLGTTFWKYGVLFLSLLTLITKIFERLLYYKIGTTQLMYFFKHHFHLFQSDPMIIGWGLCYLSAIIGCFYYSINFLGGLWRSSAQYERSSWLKNLSRLGGLLLLVTCFKILF